MDSKREVASLKAASLQFADSFRAFLTAFYHLVKVIGSASQSAIEQSPFYSPLTGRNRVDMIVGGILALVFREMLGVVPLPGGALYSLVVKPISDLLGQLFVSRTYEPPTDAPGPAGFVLHDKLEWVGRTEPARWIASPESLTIHSDIRATGLPHPSCSVRILGESPVDGSHSYLGMGIRLSDNILISPFHVLGMVGESFTLKGCNRAVVKVNFDPSKITYSNQQEDVIMYDVGAPVFTKAGVARAKVSTLELTKRVAIMACNNGTEHGVSSQGLAKVSSENIAYESDYSSLSGHSGAPVVQVGLGGAQRVVGMHLGSKVGKGVNYFLALSGVRFLTGKNTESASGSYVSEMDNEDILMRERVEAARFITEERAKLKREGDHRFDDDQMLREWEETNANAAVDFYKRNKEEFVEEFAYAPGRGWLRKGGKGKGGAMSKYAEGASAPVTRDPSRLGNWLERSAASLKEKSSQSESTRTSSTTQTSPVSSESKREKLEEASSRSEVLNKSQTPDQSLPQDLYESLRLALASGQISKTAVKSFLRSVETSSKSSTTEQTPQSEENKSVKA